MGSRQSTTKRSFDVMELQNQEDTMASTSKEPEDGVKKTKQLKQELDPFKMPNILEKIFSFLDADSIKNARQVNSLWRVEGAKILMNKCYIIIPGNLTIEDLDSNEMNEFTEFLSLKLSDRSMIPNITVGTLGDFDAWNLLGVVGPQVKAVKLKIMHPVDKFLLKLLDILPNLKYFNIQDACQSNGTIITIIKSVMSREEKKGTLLVISNMTVEAYNEMKLTEFEDFSNCTNIMMEQLKFDIKPHLFHQFPNLEARLAQILNKLLSTNQNTLKRLTLSNCQHFLSLLEFPCMFALTQMDLDFYPKDQAQQSSCKFIPSFRFLENAPNLQQICIKGRTLSGLYPMQGFSQQLFENVGPAPSVKCVEYLNDRTNLDVEILFKTFRNAEELQISVNDDPQMLFGSLWTFGTNLRKLRLAVYKDNFKWSFDVDSIFTGFAPETVVDIKNHPSLEPFSLEKLEELRVNPSILNLQELEQITIDLDFIGIKPFSVLRRMLSVAEKYATRLLPKKPQLIVNVKAGSNLDEDYVVKWALDEVSRLVNVRVKRI